MSQFADCVLGSGPYRSWILGRVVLLSRASLRAASFLASICDSWEALHAHVGRFGSVSSRCIICRILSINVIIRKSLGITVMDLGRGRFVAPYRLLGVFFGCWWLEGAYASLWLCNRLIFSLSIIILINDKSWTFNLQ